MFISHKHRLIIFPDPLGSCNWLDPRLRPWRDQVVATTPKGNARCHFFNGMSPAEAELAFDMIGLPFGSYIRIAIIQDPYQRMAQLYDRIAKTDPLWKMRRTFGLADPTFGSWLETTRPDGRGAGYALGARWRRFGAWSAQAWAADRATHLVPAEAIADHLQPILQQAGIHPDLNRRKADLETDSLCDLSRYDASSTALIKKRYWSDLRLHRHHQPDLRLIA